ncbi:FAD-binding oxidoreductase [Xylanibacillus composti]|uniref:Oxidoreductase n=1 Tax=Xylanibacillus composti TaxID=1572762 RepID=A0A8J4H7W0_9BACL|nr:FAD-dependent oxidoreductase [Xylanibacillus composti]MDT9727188.1 FAD-binding oxidoreductase [Xylanibacillus composti]GIQ71487.1 oxidoreductase [Xylanibacillus composti]
MEKKWFDAVIVGGGVIGASIFAQLIESGMTSVALIEKSSFAQGSTGKSGGMLRTYHPDSYLSDLAFESMPVFLNFRDLYRGECGYTQTGFVFLEPVNRGEDAFREVARINSKLPVLQILDLDKAKLPIRFENVGVAIYEERGGYGDPVQTTLSWIKYGREQGGIAYEGVEVKNLIVQSGKVSGIETSIGRMESDVVIVAAGAWSKMLLEGLSSEADCIRTKAIQMNAYICPEGITGPPPFIDNTTQLYSRPGPGGIISIGAPTDQWDIHPDQQYSVDSLAVEYVKNQAVKRLSWMTSAAVSGGKRSFDAYTADNRGILSSSDQVKGLFICSGWSGGGYKIAPEVGRLVKNSVISYLS